MNKKRAIDNKVSVVLAIIITLLLFVPFILAAHWTYERYLEHELDNEKNIFSDVATMGKLHILDCFESMTEGVSHAALTLSFIGTDNFIAESYFPSLYQITGADTGLVFTSKGELVYGDLEFGPLFLETAREAEASGGNYVSTLTTCSDGVKRIGIAAPFISSDGSTWAFILLYSQSSIDLMLDNLNLSDEGRLFIIDSDRNLIACPQPEQQWIEDGEFTVDESDVLIESLFTAAFTGSGKQYMAFAKPLGINNWLVVYAVPKELLYNKLTNGLIQIHVFGASAILLILAIIAFSFYRGNLISRKMVLFKKKFRIATSQSERVAFEYDRRTDRLKFISESKHFMLPKPSISLMELSKLVHPGDRPTYYQAVADLRDKGTTSVTLRVFNFCGNEVYRWYNVTATRLTKRGEGKAITIGTVEDIDERETERMVLNKKATTDSLTGLWNRAETEKVVNELLSRLEANEHSVFAIFDLDDFKNINDEYGHNCGDKVLIHFAEKLRATFRFGDVLGRLGGDEFVVYMALTSDIEVVERRLKELKEGVLSCCGENECSITGVSSSIGCCISSKDDTFDSVYKRADDALYKSKLRGKGQFTIV